MGIFDRFSRVIRAELNHQVGRRRSPEWPLEHDQGADTTEPAAPPSGPSLGLSEELQGAFATLGVSPVASREVARAAYMRGLKEHHPDWHQDDGPEEKRATELTARLNGAWDLLDAHFKRSAEATRSG